MLVGIHNAYVGPEYRPLANQAIRFDSIATVVRQHVQPAQNLGSYALRWSVSRGKEPPQVILGREKLLNWLRDSMTPNPSGLANRVYVAQADASGAGCTFSIDVLHAEIRGTKTPRAVFGARGQQLPTTPEDFLLALLRELGIILDAGDAVPPRPNASSQIGALAGEIDKLERWLSEELPNWLGSVIIKHVEKQIDIRPEAKKALEYYEHSSQAVPEEIRKNAEASEPIYVRPNAWDFAYVVVDELRSSNYRATGPRTELKGEVRSLIAALVQGKPEPLLHPGLRRLRWMFLGFLPDFVSANAGETNLVTLEVLDPEKIGVPEVAAIVDRIWEALLPRQAMNQHSVGASARFIVKKAEKNSIPQFRLSALQREANEFTVVILEEIGVK